MNEKTLKYSAAQKFLSVVLLLSVLATTVLTSGFVFDGIFGNIANAETDGIATSFLGVPTDVISVDAGTAKADIELPKRIGVKAEKDNVSKNVYFDAVWDCDDISDKTQPETEYTFKLSSTCVPCALTDGLELPTVVVKSGKYCIKGFTEISADLIVKSVTPGEAVNFPATVEAFVGDDTATTSVAVKWVSSSETVNGGTSKTYSTINTKNVYTAEIVETDKYYLTKELTDVNYAAYTVPKITVYVISTTVAYVGTGGLSTLSEAYAYINANGGSGTIVVNDYYAYYVDSSSYDPSYTVVGSQGDNYSDSYFTEPNHSGLVVIKGNTPSAVLDFNYRFYVSGPLMFKDITFKSGSSMKERMYANGNDLILGTGITCTWGTNIPDGYAYTYPNAFRIYGGAATRNINGDTNLIVLSGEYYIIRGGNEEGGTVSGNTYVYMGGTARTYYQLQGGSRRGNVSGSTYVIVNGDAIANGTSGGLDEVESVSVFGGGREGTVDGGCHVIINGGTLSAAVTGSGNTETYSGEIYVTVCGDAVINAGEHGAVYGIGDCSNYSESDSDIFITVFCNASLLSSVGKYAHIYGSNSKSNTDSGIYINVFGNAIVQGSVNGGAFAANSGVGFEGGDKKTVNVTIGGKAKITLNVYGGSLRKGIYGDSNVVIKESASVGGNVYGGGQGASSVNTTNEYGKAINSTVTISGNVSVNDVYAGGNYGYNTGNSTIKVENAVIQGSVYGGSQHGGVYGETSAYIYGSKVNGSVFGGNYGATIVYANSTSSTVGVYEGSVVSGSVYGGGNSGASGNTTVVVDDSTVKGSVYGGGVSGASGNTNVSFVGNAVISGDVFGAGKNANAKKATITVNTGFVNNIYGGGESGFAEAVEINISGTENDFIFGIEGEINGLPKAPASENDIVSNFTGDSVYVLNFNDFGGSASNVFEKCGDVDSISDFSKVNVINSTLTFTGDNSEYFEGITALYVGNGSALDIPGKAVIRSAFSAEGVYSTAGTNVLPSSLVGETGSFIAIPARTVTDEEEAAQNSSVSAILTVYGSITGDSALYVNGEKKSGTYVTSFLESSDVGSNIDTATTDYFYKNSQGVRTGHNRNFASFKTASFDTGALNLDGITEVHESDRVFTTVKNGAFGTLDGKNTSNWMIWAGEPYANILITKEGETSIDGATVALAGVEFTVYADKECTNAIETLVTNDKGTALSSDLYANSVTYYVKETKTGDNYTLDSTVYSIVLKNEHSGKTVSLTDNAIVNYLKYGEIKIVKTSDDGVLLEGVAFLVTGAENFEMVITTDGAGFATTGKLLHGDYTVTEVSNPNPGFETPDYLETVTLSDSNPEVILNITNNRVTGKVTLTKVGEDGFALSGVVFNVFSDASLETLVDTITTNEEGYAETKALTIYGASTTYYVAEAKVSEEYILREDVFAVTLTPENPVGLAADEGERVIRNYFKKANIAISKKGENDALLEGVVFGIYSDKNCTQLLETMTTDISGSATSSDLKLGTYFVKEISNPDKTYIVSDSVYEFSLSVNGLLYTQTVYNIKAGAYISLEKVDSNGNPMEGVKFEINDSNGNSVEVITTDENGKAISSALNISVGEENVFTVKEVHAPDYVYMGEEIFTAVLKDDNQIYELNDGNPIVNKIKEGYLTLEKVNESGSPLAGVEFTVYSDNALTDVVCTIITDENGKGISEVLPFGIYYVKETNNPDKSYVINPDIYTVEIVGDGSEDVLYVPVFDRPIVNFRASGCISIFKTDEEGKPLAGVEFTIYDENMRESSKVYTGEDGKVVTCSQTIQDGVNGTKYYVVETATLDEYRLDGTKYEAVLLTDGQIVEINAGNAIVNYFKRGQISLTKQSEDGTPLAGVEFTVYADKECTQVVEVMTTGADGKAISTNLKLGIYYVKETKAIAPFVPVYDVWAVSLDEDNCVKELTSTPVINYYSTGKITLLKTDDKGTPLAGVEFSIYTHSGAFVETIVTDGNGMATSISLPVKSAEGTVYVVKETKGLEGYKVDETEYAVLLKDNDQIVAVNDGEAIVNIKIVGKVTVTYTSSNDAEDQSVDVYVKVNENPYVGICYVNGEAVEVTDGIVTVKNGTSFQFELNWGDTYTVDAYEEVLTNLLSLTYNGEIKENASGKITEDVLDQKVDIVAEFELPAETGDRSGTALFAVLASLSAFALIVLEMKKRKIRG